MELADIQRFHAAFRELCFAFNRAPEDGLFDTYFKALDRFRIETVESAIDHFVNLGGSFPVPLALRTRCSDMIRSLEVNKPTYPLPEMEGSRPWTRDELKGIAKRIADRHVAKFGHSRLGGMSTVGESLQVALRHFHRK